MTDKDDRSVETISDLIDSSLAVALRYLTNLLAQQIILLGKSKH